MARTIPMAHLKVSIPLKLAKQLEEILKVKDLTMDEVARMYFRSIVTSSIRNKALGLGDTIPFGKYQGEYVEVITKADPSYIEWLIDNSIKVKFQPEVLMLLEVVNTKES